MIKIETQPLPNDNAVLSDRFASFFQDDIVKQFQEEIRKLKAIIVKHENRIRALEARVPPQSNDEDESYMSKQSTRMRHENEQESELAPDEV